MSFIFDNWNCVIKDAVTSINLVGFLPNEVVLEIQHALIHLLIGLQFARQSESVAKRREIERAISHVQRAHLDVLKICLFAIHTRLVEERRDTDCQKAKEFQKKAAQARVAEVQSMGTGHEQAIQAFREIINEFSSPRTPPQVSYPLPPGAEAQTSVNYQIFDEECCHLLWEWAQLEVLHTSLSGQQVYGVSYKMVDAYLSWKDFAKELKKAVSLLKVYIVLLLLKNDCDASFYGLVSSLPEGQKLLEIRSKLGVVDSEDVAQSERVARALEQLVEAVFPQVKDFLGISLNDTL